MKVVINACFGSFNISYEGMMEYAKQKGIKLYAFVDKRDKDGKRIGIFEEYVPKGEHPWIIHYSTKPLNQKGRYDEGAYFNNDTIERNDPALVKTVEKLGKKANGDCANLKIVEIPDGIRWEIDEYDGNESVEECHNRWS